MVSQLTDAYYADCNEVFRSSTDQSELMLREVMKCFETRERATILSVGSGVGLFEIPMLKELIAQGLEVPAFMGIDSNSYACRVLKTRLREAFKNKTNFTVVNRSFEDYTTYSRYDLILFNHVFEYLRDQHRRWIEKSLELRSDGGNVLIFSPNKGGINNLYASLNQTTNGFEPFFADKIVKMLEDRQIPYSSTPIHAHCDISLLYESSDNEDKVKLLSFLTQVDCREVPDSQLDEFIEYFDSLRIGTGATISHPAILFVL